jgi:hypothetical protein
VEEVFRSSETAVTVKHRVRVCLSDYDNLNVVDLPHARRTIERQNAAYPRCPRDFTPYCVSAS